VIAIKKAVALPFFLLTGGKSTASVVYIKAVHEEANADLNPSSLPKPKQAMEVAM